MFLVTVACRVEPVKGSSLSHRGSVRVTRRRLPDQGAAEAATFTFEDQQSQTLRYRTSANFESCPPDEGFAYRHGAPITSVASAQARAPSWPDSVTTLPPSPNEASTHPVRRYLATAKDTPDVPIEAASRYDLAVGIQAHPKSSISPVDEVGRDPSIPAERRIERSIFDVPGEREPPSREPSLCEGKVRRR